MRYVLSSDVPNAASAPGMMVRAPAIKSQPGGLYIRKPYVSFTYKVPLTCSRTGGGSGGFAGGGAGVGCAAAAGAGDFAATTGGAFFAAFGAADADEDVVAGALATADALAAGAGAVAGLLGGAAVDPAGGGVELFVIATGVAGGAEAAGDAEDGGALVEVGAFGGSAGAGALEFVTTGVGAGAAAVSVLAGLGDATGFSVAGSDFFSPSGFPSPSDMLMLTT